jgi:phosphoribosylamine--glycine ligase
MKVLVVGSGGREAALVWKIAQSPIVEKVYCAPGNAGTSSYAINLPIAETDIVGLIKAVEQEEIFLTVVGPELPLTMGIVDAFEDRGLIIFGPRKNAAVLEGSKVFAKKLFKKYDLPTAEDEQFTDAELALQYVRKRNFPLVIKADGLAAGKGVVICADEAEAERTIQEMMVLRTFGDAGNQIVVEEFLEGEEASAIALIDKNGHILILEFSQDHKRVGDGDTGLNTGGMGAYSPAPVVTPDVKVKVEEIIRRTVAAMAQEGRPFVGVLYAGLMIKDGEPKLLEYNVRFGDPETQPLMLRMVSDIVPILLACLRGCLDEIAIEWDLRPAVCVALAAFGYPESPRKGARIWIASVPGTENSRDAVIFHGGTARNEKGELVVAGGRVLYGAALGETFLEAQQNAYRQIARVQCNELFCRKDIAHRAIKRALRR